MKLFLEGKLYEKPEICREPSMKMVKSSILRRELATYKMTLQCHLWRNFKIS